MRSRGGACADGLPSSAEGPEEPGRPRDEAGAQGAGARLQGTEQGQNRAREKLCAAEEPPECKDRPGGEACGRRWVWTPSSSVLPKAGPGRLAVPPALDAPEASLCLEEGNWECSPVPPLSELFLTLTLPSHPSGQCPSLHPCPLNSSPHPRLF